MSTLGDCPLLETPPGGQDRVRMGTTGQERQEWLRFEISSGWLGKVTGFLDVPRHAPCFHRRKKKTMYALAGDRVACRWVRRFVGELVRACEDLRRPGLPPKLRTDRADEKRWSTFWKSYRRSGLTKALRDEGFNVSVLRPIIERLLDAIDAATSDLRVENPFFVSFRGYSLSCAWSRKGTVDGPTRRLALSVCRSQRPFSMNTFVLFRPQ